MRIPVPEDRYLAKLGLALFLVSDLEGFLLFDLLRFRPVLPPELDFTEPIGMRLTGWTTTRIGKYLLEHAPNSADPRVAEYFRAGGTALVEVGPQRNAMLHARPGVEGGDPEQRLRLLRWRVPGATPESDRGPEMPHMISDEWLDSFIERVMTLRLTVSNIRPPQPPYS